MKFNVLQPVNGHILKPQRPNSLEPKGGRKTHVVLL